jgi:hypothetical protein
MNLRGTPKILTNPDKGEQDIFNTSQWSMHPTHATNEYAKCVTAAKRGQTAKL